MKKILFILGLILLSSCNLNTQSDCYKCININYNDLNILINKKESFIIVIKDNNCSICQKYNYVLDKTIKSKNIRIYSLDSTLLDLKDIKIKKFIESIKLMGGANDNAILPSTLFYYKGELIDCEIGFLNNKELNNKIQLFFLI